MATTEEKETELREKGVKEGNNLLGTPTFTELENDRFKCVETGHEVLARDKESYSQSKRCRLGLIDYAVSHKEPPLNMFKQDPLSRSRLICKLTGHTVNKNEEHIWKHVNGKRFLNKLEQKEMQKELDGAMVEEDEEKPQGESKPSANGLKKEKKKGKKKEKKEKGVDEIISEVRDVDSDSEEADFWMPPVGQRWDSDEGGDRWGSGSESAEELNEENGTVEDGGEESEELSTRAKRMSIEIGPSSFASRKKKSKKNSSS